MYYHTGLSDYYTVSISYQFHGVCTMVQWLSNGLRYMLMVGKVNLGGVYIVFPRDLKIMMIWACYLIM